MSFGLIAVAVAVRSSCSTSGSSAVFIVITTLRLPFLYIRSAMTVLASVLRLCSQRPWVKEIPNSSCNRSITVSFAVYIAVATNRKCADTYGIAVVVPVQMRMREQFSFYS